ncbi:MAG TPA: hypothetical protein VJR58_16525 [Vineibacter sp.]|nr:hypothetical protein [Vineibacter sp.]
MDDIFDLTCSPIVIPRRFWDVPFNDDCYPGKAVGFAKGANCQQYAYEFLRHWGFQVPDFRSSDLWEDVEFTAIADRIEPFDIVMVHKGADAWGAHIGVALGENAILHLSKRNGVPAIETLDALMSRPEYRFLIGAKRCLKRA